MSPAAAQSREIYMGSTSGRDRDPRGTAYPGNQPRSYGTGVDRQQSETDGLLEDALADLARGRVLEARRLLELVVERFSNTQSAEDARRLLAPIYAGSGRPPGGTPVPDTNTGQEARPDGIRPASIPAPGPERTVPERDASAERQRRAEIVRLRSLDQDFRSNVGDRVFFAEASTELGARSRVVLAAQAAWLKRNPDLTIAIEAHADDPGSREFNRALAERRAEIVHTRLVEEGVAPTRILIKAFGQDKPVATCPGAACTAQNRRVVTLIEVEPRQGGTRAELGQLERGQPQASDPMPGRRN